MTGWKLWALRGGVALVLLALAWALNHERRALQDALRGKSDAEARLSNHIVADQGTQRDLNAKVDDAKKASALLATALEAATRDVPGTKAVFVADLRTKAVPVIAPVQAPDQQAPEPVPLPPCASNKYAPDGLGGFYCIDLAPDKPKQATCVLGSQDQVSFQVREVGLTNKAGTGLLTGVTELWRESPVPRSKLAEGAFSSGLSGLNVVAKPPEPRWGAELGASLGRDGAALGVGVLFPPFTLPLLGLRVETRLDVASPPALGVQGWLGVRL